MNLEKMKSCLANILKMASSFPTNKGTLLNLSIYIASSAKETDPTYYLKPYTVEVK